MQLIRTLRLINPIVPDGLIDFPNSTEKCPPQWIEVLMQTVGWKPCLHAWVGTEKPITIKPLLDSRKDLIVQCVIYT